MFGLVENLRRMSPVFFLLIE